MIPYALSLVAVIHFREPEVSSAGGGVDRIIAELLLKGATPYTLSVTVAASGDTALISRIHPKVIGVSVHGLIFDITITRGIPLHD